MKVSKETWLKYMLLAIGLIPSLDLVLILILKIIYQIETGHKLLRHYEITNYGSGLLISVEETTCFIFNDLFTLQYLFSIFAILIYFRKSNDIKSFLVVSLSNLLCVLIFLNGMFSSSSIINWFFD